MSWEAGDLQGCLDLALTTLSPPNSLQRSVSDNTLVAMDFSGRAGRVIENPREALSAAVEEAQAWRVRGRAHLLSMGEPLRESPGE